MNNSRFTIGQFIGALIFVVCCDGLPAAGFKGGTGWSILGWLALSLFGGALGGLLMARNHRFAGLVGGFIAGPLGLLGVYLYARNRDTIHTAETFIVLLVCSLPGLLVYFVLRLITNAIFGPPRDNTDDREYDDDEDDDDRPRGRRRRRDDDDDDEDDDRPRKRRRRRDDDDRDDEEDDDRPRKRSRRKRDNHDEDDEDDHARRRREEDGIE